MLLPLKKIVEAQPGVVAVRAVEAIGVEAACVGAAADSSEVDEDVVEQPTRPWSRR